MTTNHVPNLENIRKWIDALRSGEYKQTVGALRDSSGYCCLGVACDLAVKAGVPMRLGVLRDAITIGGEKVVKTYDGNHKLPPLCVSDWLGFEDANLRMSAHTSTSAETLTLSEWNDRSRVDFRKIADMLDYHFFPPAVTK